LSRNAGLTDAELEGLVLERDRTTVNPMDFE